MADQGVGWGMGVGIVLRRLLAFLPSVTVADLDFELRRGCGFNLLARLAFLPSAKIRGGGGWPPVPLP